MNQLDEDNKTKKVLWLSECKQWANKAHASMIELIQDYVNYYFWRKKKHAHTHTNDLKTITT